MLLILHTLVTKKMANPKNNPQDKKEAIKARVTAHLTGDLKRRFFEEVIRTGVSESYLIKEILQEHYNKHRF